MKPIKYVNFFLEAVYFIFLYILFIASLWLAPVSKAFYALPAAGILWKLFSYHIVLPDFVKGRRERSRKNYSGSLEHYEKCLALLMEKPWLDRYRFFFMASSLRISLVSVCYSNVVDLLLLLEKRGEAVRRAAELCRLEPLGPVTGFLQEKFNIPPVRVYANSFEDLKELISATHPWLELLHIGLCLALLFCSLVCMPSPWLVSLSAALIVGVYFFWRFGLVKLVFRGIDSPDDSRRLAACRSALETLERHPFLDRGRRLLFLSAGRYPYRECFLCTCFMLTLLKGELDAAREYALKLQDPPVRDECLALLESRK